MSIIIPTLNEERNLPRVLKDLASLKTRFRFETIIVDGNSRDATVRIARSAGARITYDSLGKGSAIIKGLSVAKGDVIVIMDADCSHAASELPRMISLVSSGRCGVCMGSRFMKGGGSDDITPLRVFGNKMFVLMVNLIWGTKYTDLCYGYRAFSKDAARRLRGRLQSKGFGIETEISILCAKEGIVTEEVPSFEKPRLHGESNLKTFRDGFLILSTIIREAVFR